MADTRLHPAGWFARAFALTLGVLLAIVAAGALSWAIAIALAVSAAPRVRVTEETRDQPSAKVLSLSVVEAQKAALPQLRRMGLRRFAAAASVERDGSLLTLIANSPDEAGEMRPVTFTFDTSGDEWALVEYSLDGTKYKRKP